MNLPETFMAWVFPAVLINIIVIGFNMTMPSSVVRKYAVAFLVGMYLIVYSILILIHWPKPLL